MRITLIKTPCQLRSKQQRSYAGKNRKDPDSRNDLKTALRRIKEGDRVNTDEINALTKNGYNPSFKGENKGTIDINKKSYKFTVETDSE